MEKKATDEMEVAAKKAKRRKTQTQGKKARCCTLKESAT